MTTIHREHSRWAQFRYVRQTVLGLNRRNGRYLFPLNPIELLPLVDEKEMTKTRLNAHALPTPATYDIIHHRYELRRLESVVAAHAEFVVKPARGYGGGGIVICERTADGLQLSHGRRWRIRDLVRHVDAILDGVYSLDERSDTAIVEQRLHLDPVLDSLAVTGLPDLRFLVIRGIPLLAMLRLPTRRSAGRANLHVGGVGVGIDLTTGITRHGLYRGLAVRRHPDTEAPLAGHALPHWPRLLEISARCYDAVPLGYLGVDIVFDRDHGPMVLELNGRPGLQIQLANNIGLRPLLEALDGVPTASLSVAERVACGLATYQMLWERAHGD
ncbi:MAG: alpha-L-glutamate ligase-like protein [Deltaproteobacteria bacterium]|nr:alpha-L-glutamate ligase-like protein [Deltaproteobacteria bacterium]